MNKYRIVELNNGRFIVEHLRLGGGRGFYRYPDKWIKFGAYDDLESAVKERDRLVERDKAHVENEQAIRFGQSIKRVVE